MKYKALIFDMDGTILYTLDDLTDSINYAHEKLNLPKRQVDQVVNWVGNGIGLLVERALPDDKKHLKEQALKLFFEYYSVHSMDKTRPYDHIIDLLKEVKARGYKTAVVSNKEINAAKGLAKQFFDGLFDCVMGEMPFVAKKPAPDMVYLALKELDEGAENAVYIGDSDVDYQTAVNANLPCISVSWGFKSKEFLQDLGAKTIVDTPMQILEVI